MFLWLLLSELFCTELISYRMVLPTLNRRVFLLWCVFNISSPAVYVQFGLSVKSASELTIFVLVPFLGAQGEEWLFWRVGLWWRHVWLSQLGHHKVGDTSTQCWWVVASSAPWCGMPSLFPGGQHGSTAL